jgi:hypothetical protein
MFAGWEYFSASAGIESIVLATMRSSVTETFLLERNHAGLGDLKP